MPDDGSRRPLRRLAYLANPDVYRIEEALAHLPTGLWPTYGRDIDFGDQVVFWRTQKHKPPRDLRRGVIALGEVIDRPQIVNDHNDGFWVREPPVGSEERIKIRYVRLPGLPLWLGGS